MLKELLENVRKQKPLIHSITNYVTANDCANILLACGASPIMADDSDEAEDITALCAGLNINIGTPDKRTVPSMIAAGKKANELRHPVVFDPVGTGSSVFRTKTAMELLEKIRFDIIKGNISEIKALSGASGTTQGVDADISDLVTKDNLIQAVDFAKAFAAKTNAVIVITGETDIVANAEKAYVIYNGHQMMSSITGTGCQLSALTAAYAAANPDKTLESAVAAVCSMCVCGEIAYERMQPQDGNASYRNYLIDAVYNLDGETLEKRAKYIMI